MKEFLKIVCIFAALVIIIPLIGFMGGQPTQEESYSSENITESISDTTSATKSPDPDIFSHAAADKPFFLLECESGDVLEMTVEEYVIGAVLAEMPAFFEKEALKAQAVAVHTYALRRISEQLASPDAELHGAYISNDSSKYQAYFTPEQAAAFYGESYEKYRQNVAEAVSESINDILVYNGEPIVAAFHSISSGKTESAEIIWGNAVPYLIPTESTGDLNAPSYSDTAVFSAAEAEARLTESEYDITLPEEQSEWFKILSVSPSGTVTKVSVGDKILSGTELRSLLNLRSACFEISCADSSFTFTTKGSGHGVGLSQYGANEMAKNGADYREILLHYYNGAEIYTIASN